MLIGPTPLPRRPYANYHCGRYRFCLVGRETLCDNLRGYVGVQTNGGYAEYVVVPAQNVVPIPPELDYASASILPGAVQFVKLAGARVIAADASDERLAEVQKLGADEVVNVLAGDPVAAVLGLTGGLGVDKLLELVVTTDSLDRSFRCLGKGGAMAIMGSQPGSRLDIDPVRVLQGERTVTTTRSNPRRELAEVLSLVARGALRPIVSETRPLADAQEVLYRLKKNLVYGRIVLQP